MEAASMRAAAAMSGESERCPRCGSRNTKFCYYNNYNLAQPRHFCKSCRRYWTLGGSLRNVPIGGSTRSNPVAPALPHHRHQPTKQPHHSSAGAASIIYPSSKRRRAGISAGPSPSNFSPAPSSIATSNAASARTSQQLTFDHVPSAAPVTAAAKPDLSAIDVQPAPTVDVLGSFVSLLTEPLPAGGFPASLAGADHLAHGRDEEFGIVLGFGVGPTNVGFGMARPPAPAAWPLFVENGGAAGLFGAGVAGDGGLGGLTGELDVWPPMPKGTELVGGCYGWTELGTMTTATSGKAV